MTVKLGASIGLAAVLTFWTAIPAAHAAEARVTICHIPPGNPLNAHTITVGESALKAHLSHGDRTGSCPSTCVDAEACDDANRCTDDACVAGFCDNSPVDCNDGNVCTDDQCDPTAGCTNPPTGQSRSCDDDDLCTANDACDGAGACAGDPVAGCCLTTQDCTATDPDACTIEQCQGTACVTVAEVTCTPPDACTISTCLDGNCVNAPKDCGDGVCNPETGECRLCDNGVVEAPEQCDDGANNGDTKPCTASCRTAICGDGLICSDPTCTSALKCEGGGGTCTPGPEECDDANDVPNDQCNNSCIDNDGGVD